MEKINFGILVYNESNCRETTATTITLTIITKVRRSMPRKKEMQ